VLEGLRDGIKGEVEALTRQLQARAWPSHAPLL